MQKIYLEMLYFDFAVSVLRTLFELIILKTTFILQKDFHKGISFLIFFHVILSFYLRVNYLYS